MPMNDVTDVPADVLGPIPDVVQAVLAHSPSLAAENIMVVGAWCRDIHHRALGHQFSPTATHDLDLALALGSWDAYHAIAAQFPPVGSTGFRYLISGYPVDLLPFGGIEDPTGFVAPSPRRQPFSVWALSEVLQTALTVEIADRVTVRIPTVAGYAGLKIGAWLDRSEHHESKDAADLALVMHWYAESSEIADRLYDTPVGNDVLIAEELDLPRAAARLLGGDITSTIGIARTSEMRSRWPGNEPLLVRSLGFFGTQWPKDTATRRERLGALTAGLMDTDL